MKKKHAMFMNILFLLSGLSCIGRGDVMITTENSSFEMRLVDESDSGEKKYTSHSGDEMYALETDVLINGRDLASVSSVQDEYGSYSLDIRLNREGSARFQTITGNNTGRRLAILVDGRVVTAPVIMIEIPGGAIRVSGNFSEAEARDMARKIRGQ